MQLNGLFVGDCNGAGGLVVAQQVKTKMVNPVNPEPKPYKQVLVAAHGPRETQQTWHAFGHLHGCMRHLSQFKSGSWPAAVLLPISAVSWASCMCRQHTADQMRGSRSRLFTPGALWKHRSRPTDISRSAYGVQHSIAACKHLHSSGGESVLEALAAF